MQSLLKNVEKLGRRRDRFDGRKRPSVKPSAKRPVLASRAARDGPSAAPGAVAPASGAVNESPGAVAPASVNGLLVPYVARVLALLVIWTTAIAVVGGSAP